MSNAENHLAVSMRGCAGDRGNDSPYGWSEGKRTVYINFYYVNKLPKYFCFSVLHFVDSTL